MADLTPQELYSLYVDACTESGATPKTFSEYSGIEPEKPNFIKTKLGAIRGKSVIGWLLFAIGCVVAGGAFFPYFKATANTDFGNATWVILGLSTTSAVIHAGGTVMRTEYRYSSVRTQDFFGYSLVLGIIFALLSLPVIIALDYKIQNKRYLDPLLPLLDEYGCLLDDKTADAGPGVEARINFWSDTKPGAQLYEANVTSRGEGENRLLFLELTDSRSDLFKGDRLYEPEELFAEVCGNERN